MCDTGGQIRAFDCSPLGGAQTWSVQLNSPTVQFFLYALADPIDPSKTRVLVVNPVTNNVRAFNGESGAALWTQPFPTALGSYPNAFYGCVLQNAQGRDALLLAMGNGDIRSIDANGIISSPIANEPGAYGVIAVDGHYFTAISADVANANGGLGSGAWGGLFISTAQLFVEAGSGAQPFFGTLDAVGQSSFVLPAGSIPASLFGVTLYAVTSTYNPSTFGNSGWSVPKALQLQ